MTLFLSLFPSLSFCLAPRQPSRTAEPSSVRKSCTGDLCFSDSIFYFARDSIDDAVSVLISASHLSPCISLEGFISLISISRTHRRVIHARYTGSLLAKLPIQFYIPYLIFYTLTRSRPFLSHLIALISVWAGSNCHRSNFTSPLPTSRLL